MAGNLKEVRDRIKSVQNTQQITRAMKMVSAAKLRRAQEAIQQMRPYADKLNAMLRNILSNIDDDASSSFSDARPVESPCLVVVTSNRGLCGAFNANVIKSALATLETKYAEPYAQGKVTMLFIGKKGYEYFAKRYENIRFINDHVPLFEDLTFENIAKVSQHLMDGFLDGTYDAIEVSYGRFKNAATQFAETELFLPVPKLERSEEDKKIRADYIFEPSKEGLLRELVPSILQTQFQKYLLDTHASEHGARMTAMDKATDNAQELLKELKLSYNKARQEAITNEILEIVSGAAALEG